MRKREGGKLDWILIHVLISVCQWRVTVQILLQYSIERERRHTVVHTHNVRIKLWSVLASVLFGTWVTRDVEREREREREKASFTVFCISCVSDRQCGDIWNSNGCLPSHSVKCGGEGNYCQYTHYPMGFWSYIYLCVAYCISCPASLAWPSLLCDRC